jgi:hypothetical protein
LAGAVSPCVNFTTKEPINTSTANATMMRIRSMIRLPERGLADLVFLRSLLRAFCNGKNV